MAFMPSAFMLIPDSVSPGPTLILYKVKKGHGNFGCIREIPEDLFQGPGTCTGENSVRRSPEGRRQGGYSLSRKAANT